MAIDRTKITSLILEEKVQNYSFSIGFLLIFSLFVYFAIRPNLVTAFNLEKEKQDLRLQNRKYEEQILQIVNYQSTIEEYRDKLYLLDEAVPSSPAVTKIINDVKKSASESGILLTSVTVDEIEFSKDVEQYEQVFEFTVSTTGNVQIQQLEQFINALMN
ncbi:MAG TPA: hypothetical protein PLS49_00800, partial [Candidatus Woesebacteria bacterium]|nr:hypothetical protein [Candidatus Woesebacteria bacterium]